MTYADSIGRKRFLYYGDDVAVLLHLLAVAVNSFLLTATNSVTPEADTVAQVGKA